MLDLICKIYAFGSFQVDKWAETPENPENPENPKMRLNHLDDRALNLFPTIIFTTCLSINTVLLMLDC